ncbi:MAG: Crp/Fnr family transcriptional regulator [Bacteroidota bacterium]
MEKLIEKGQILQRAGDLNSKVYLVQSGLLRSYSIDRKGREHIFMFAPEDWIVGDAIPPQQPCELFIDAIETSTVWVYEKDPEISMIDKERIRKRLEVIQKRLIMLMSATALERYEHFLRTYPDIVQRVPQRMIASFLGITPEALSKIKGRRRKDKGS